MPAAPQTARLGWALLALLLAITLAGAATLDRRDWPSLVGDEAAYLMQAESLAWDLDLTYSRRDYDRFVEHWGMRPEGLILQSGDGGATLTYGKPVYYSAAIAPFVRLAPTRGAAVANALLLALAALAAAAALRRPLGAAAPVWVAALVFASVTFANVYWAHADLFLACLVAIALALVYGAGEITAETGRGGAGRWPGWRWPGWRWLAAGALLAVVALSRPFYAALLLPAAWAAWGLPAARRRAALAGLAGGVGGLLLLTLALNLPLRGSWTSYGGQRMGFYSATGFPGVELPPTPEGWRDELARRPGSGSWVAREKLRFDVDARLLAYDAAYFLAGGHVGVLPYFLPGLLGLLLLRCGGRRWPLLAAVALVAAAFFVVRPFNFYGGGAALANRYFLPVYPALWFVASRPPFGRRTPAVTAALALAATLAAAPFLLPLWSAPRAYPLAAGGGWRYVSAAARALPYETTLDHLKPAGREDLTHDGLWVKLLTPTARAVADGEWLHLDPPGGELLLGSPRPIERLRLEVAPPAPARLRAGGRDLEADRLPGGGAVFHLTPRRTAHHRMWWSDQPWHLYRLEIEAPAASGPLRLRLSTDPPPATP